MAGPDRNCFHCGEPVPPGSAFRLTVEGEDRAMCCAGCLAVAELIHRSGFQRYYRFRKALGRRVGDDLDRLVPAWRSVDDREELWGIPLGDGQYDLLLQTEGIHCAACAWLIRSELTKLRAVDDVQVDISSGYTRIRWRPAVGRLSRLAGQLLRLGYKPHLPIAAEEERARQEERNASLKRLGVAGLGMMQVMMYAVGLYAGEAQGIDSGPRRFLEWVSLLVTTPVLIYSGRVFIEGAIAGLRARRPGMDLPVALAITGAYAASCVNFFAGTGEVWFDSVVMFIFFLSLARHVEMSLRHRNQQSGTVLARLLPEWAERTIPGGTETVALDELQPGDRVRVRAGEAFPADGLIIDGLTGVNESLLTGESLTLQRGAGDRVIAGSINVSQPVTVEVETCGEASTVSALGRLIRRARTLRCQSVEAADRYAGFFVLGVLLIAGLTFLWWQVHDPSRVLAITLSVLVVSCPCAFSLASPAVLAAASRKLLGRGIVLTRGSALEGLADVGRVIFDKTGTLTSGEPRIDSILLNPRRPDLKVGLVKGIAAALEQFSAHPVAQAFGRQDRVPEATGASVEQGRGIRGIVGGKSYRIGSFDYVGPQAGEQAGLGADGIWLADEQGWLAVFRISDSIRPGVKPLVDRLRGAGLKISILSGDHPRAVSAVADELGITDWQAKQSPEMKLELLSNATGDPAGVLMVGDGVNDAPVLAAADVSISVQGGSELANTAADFILTGRSLMLVWEARDIALAARRIVHQNLGWAATYNLVMVPLAFGGFLQPWMAALGMSASSLLVVLNAARITRQGSRGESGGVSSLSEPAPS